MSYRPLHLNVVVVPEDDRYMARCPQLRITDYGPTREAALEALGETLGLFIEACMHRGVLGQVLRDNGVLDFPEELNGKEVVPIPMLHSTYHDAAGAG